MKPTDQTIDDFLNILPAVLYEYHQNQDGTGTIKYFSPNSKDIIGYPSEQFIDKDFSSILKFIHDDDRARFEKEDVETVNDPFFTTELRIVLPSKEIRWARCRSKPASKSTIGVVKWVGCIVDITELKEAKDELKQLRGILPLCSFCKKIRDDKGYWEQVDVYIDNHSEAEISHSICPECMSEYYPDID